jgi:hypothetical protein
VRFGFTGLILLAAMTTAAAAPQIPSSELPGRERQRFLESPVDRFTDPQRKTKPLWQRDCEEMRSKRKTKRKRRDC